MTVYPKSLKFIAGNHTMAWSNRIVQCISSPLHLPDYLSVCTSCTLETAKNKVLMDRISSIRPLNSICLVSNSDELSVSRSKMGLACRCKQWPTEAETAEGDFAAAQTRDQARPIHREMRRSLLPRNTRHMKWLLAVWKFQCFLILACLATPDLWLAVLVTIQGDSQSARDRSK